MRLPIEYRFDCNEVYIRRDPNTGDILLSRHPDSWDAFFALDNVTEVPVHFIKEEDRSQGELVRDPLEGTAI